MGNPLLDATPLPAFSAIAPEDVEPAVAKILEDNRSRLAQLLDAAGSVEFDAAILPMEMLNEAFHRVWAPVRHLHSVVNTPELRSAYNRCLAQVSRYHTELAQNRGLFEVYRRAGEALGDCAEPSKQRLIEHALRDFRLAGVDLPEEEQRRFKAIMEELSEVQAGFEQNVLDAMAGWSCHVDEESRVAGIPPAVLDPAAERAAEAGKEGWLFALDMPTYVAIVSNADDRDLRKSFYEAWTTRASDQGPGAGQFDNSANMERILNLRHEAARLVGYDNYAEYSLATKMATTPGEVQAFLDELARHSLPVARREYSELEEFAGRELAAWDVAYFSEKLKQERFSISDEELRPWFPLDRVLDGLFRVVGELYGYSFELRQNIETWHPDVRYYCLLDSAGNEQGGIYCDFYARKGKRSGAWMDEARLRLRLNGKLQTPVAHVVCNYTAPTGGAAALLTHNEVLTLFHEFGHALHHVLTRVDYPSVSGISGVPWDAVELPSQFMENFAWEASVVPWISRHCESGDPLPAETLEKLRASRVFQAGLAMCRQLELGMFDLRLHSRYDPEQGARVNETLEAARAAVAIVQYPDFNRMAHAFDHIFGGGYAAGYYSYKWAEVLAADAYGAFEEAGIFDPSTATSFLDNVLSVGGTVNIADAFERFRGRAPDYAALLKQCGIDAVDGEVA